MAMLAKNTLKLGISLRQISNIILRRGMELRRVLRFRNWSTLMLRITGKLLFCESNDMFVPLPKLERKNLRFANVDEGVLRQYFRFNNLEQLERFSAAFRFPAKMITEKGERFHREEVILIGLYRLHSANNLSDPMYRTVFGFNTPTASKACAIIMKYMVNWWGYLVLDNL